MINLLPVEEKQKIQKAYRLRTAIVACAGAAVIFMINIFGLVPSYVGVLSKHETLTFQSGAAGGGGDGLGAETRALEEKITKANKNTQILLGEKDAELPRELFAEILSKKTSGTKITEISYSVPSSNETASADKKGEKKMPAIILAGIADTRESLLSFVNVLNESGMFSSVDLPISNFVKDRNLGFSINIEVKQKHHNVGK